MKNKKQVLKLGKVSTLTQGPPDRFFEKNATPTGKGIRVPAKKVGEFYL
jgi:hypothetical protein